MLNPSPNQCRSPTKENRTASGQEDPKPYKQALRAVQGSSAMTWYNDYCQEGLFFHVFVSLSSNFLLLPNFMHQRSKDKRSGLVWRQQTPLHQERVSKGALWGTACRMQDTGRFPPRLILFCHFMEYTSLRANCMKKKKKWDTNCYTKVGKNRPRSIHQTVSSSYLICKNLCLTGSPSESSQPAYAQNHIKYWSWIDIL